MSSLQLLCTVVETEDGGTTEVTVETLRVKRKRALLTEKAKKAKKER